MEHGEGERAKRIEWVSSVVDEAIMYVAISRVLIHREYFVIIKAR